MPQLRPLTASDFPAVTKLFEGLFPSKYMTEFYDAWKYRAQDLSLGAFEGGGPGTTGLLGFIICCRKKGPGGPRISIEFLGINPASQKGGIGTILLRHILDVCDKTNTRATLVPVNDQRIIHWYKKHGFAFYGTPFVSSYTGDLEHLMIYGAQPADKDPGGLGPTAVAD
jgi:ribosomal protein S18 acetylase RimI-like enzyme